MTKEDLANMAKRHPDYYGYITGKIISRFQSREKFGCKGMTDIEARTLLFQEKLDESLFSENQGKMSYFETYNPPENYDDRFDIAIDFVNKFIHSKAYIHTFYSYWKEYRQVRLEQLRYANIEAILEDTRQNSNLDDIMAIDFYNAFGNLLDTTLDRYLWQASLKLHYAVGNGLSDLERIYRSVQVFLKSNRNKYDRSIMTRMEIDWRLDILYFRYIAFIATKKLFPEDKVLNALNNYKYKSLRSFFFGSQDSIKILPDEEMLAEIILYHHNEIHTRAKKHKPEYSDHMPPIEPSELRSLVERFDAKAKYLNNENNPRKPQYKSKIDRMGKRHQNYVSFIDGWGNVYDYVYSATYKIYEA
jgi:hypothetical protein